MKMMEVGTIKAVHIYMYRGMYVTAALELILKGVKYTFGGPDTFHSGMHGGDSCDAPYLGRFLFRCMQICNVESWDQLKSSKVVARLSGGRVVAIGNPDAGRWFNPAEEFEMMDREKEQSAQQSDARPRH